MHFICKVDRERKVVLLCPVLFLVGGVIYSMVLDPLELSSLAILPVLTLLTGACKAALSGTSVQVLIIISLGLTMLAVVFRLTPHTHAYTITY